ncbi:MAG TPA: inorganic diphosphatase, partial [Stellaceae bacterium]|nr:inorganic diphosphatase [Stellaceae bacterium]
VPHTRSQDGDPLDALIVGPTAVVPGSVVRCRPVGVLLMEDEAGVDEKLITVPVDKLHPFYTDVKSYADLPAIMCEQIEHFFTHYKDLEPGKWVKVTSWAGPDEAAAIIDDSIARARA